MDQFLIIDLEFCKTDKYIAKLNHYYLTQEIIQIGAVILDEDNQVIDRFSSFVRPIYGALDQTISELTGITDADLKDAPVLKEALHAMSVWIGDRHLIAGSWSTSDYRQLTREMEQKRIDNEVIEALFSDWVDLQKAYKDMYGANQASSLSKALTAETVEIEGRLHDGSVDALNTARLIRAIRSRKEEDFKTEAIDKSTEYSEDMGFTFGSVFANLKL